MAEVTDTYYRSLIKELGGVGLVVSEFISAESLTRKNDRSHQMLAFSENERPVAIQIYGGDPERMDDAAAIVEAEGVDIVDVNMGCPVRKIVNSGAGSALLKDFDKAARVVEKIKAAVKIPVTVKVRKGWESDGVMIGRAALHNPFIFRDIHAYVSGERNVENEIDRRIDAMQRYLAKIDAAPQIDKWKLHKARTVIGWFSKGIPHGKDIRTGLHDITAVADVQRLLDNARLRLVA